MEYLFLFSFPGYFPQTTFLCSGYGFCSVSLCSAPVTRLLCWWFGFCVILRLFLWGCFLVGFFWCSCSTVPFCFRSCFLTSVPGLNALLFSLWKIYHVCKGRLSCTEKQMRERMFLRGCCLKDASKALKKGLSLLFPSSEPPNTWVSCVLKHFPVKREVWGKCYHVVLCCFQLNRTIYFSYRMIWCHNFIAGGWSLCMSLTRIFIWS